jgi:hypothetical protein
MARHEDSTFTDTTVQLDGNSYVGCRFIRCEILYSGGALPGEFGDNVLEHCRFRFTDAAERTVQLLAAFHGSGMHELVRETLKQIARENQPPPRTQTLH